MNYLYFDSSALAKRYYEEIGTDFVNELCRQENIAIVISDITVAELGSAFAKKLREGNITEDEYIIMLDNLMKKYLKEYVRIAIDFEILVLATHLAKKNSLRAYDSVQLACAMNFRETIALREPESNVAFVVADYTLEKAAIEEGFKTINPNFGEI